MIRDTFKTLSKRGNLKIGKDTLIFNMGSAEDCPSLKNGYCKVGHRCYALKDEKIYPDCKPYRDRQATYWLNTQTKQIIEEIDTSYFPSIPKYWHKLDEIVKFFFFSTVVEMSLGIGIRN